MVSQAIVQCALGRRGESEREGERETLSHLAEQRVLYSRITGYKNSLKKGKHYDPKKVVSLMDLSLQETKN